MFASSLLEFIKLPSLNFILFNKVKHTENLHSGKFLYVAFHIVIHFLIPIPVAMWSLTSRYELPLLVL